MLNVPLERYSFAFETVVTFVRLLLNVRSVHMRKYSDEIFEREN